LPLSGRSLNIHLGTFSFAEFLDFRAIDYSDELARVRHRIEIARAKKLDTKI
jgi:predicted AAA+ superfamily ATPase